MQRSDQIVYVVTLHVCGLDPNGEQIARLVQHGFGDALITREGVTGRGVIEVELDEPLTMARVRAFLSQVGAWSDARVYAVGPSSLVNAADIAQRIGRTRQNIGQYASGARGPGGWPAAVNTGGGAPLWEWGDVARWLNRYLDAGIPGSEIEHADTVAWVNALLRLSNAEHVPDEITRVRANARDALGAS